MHQTSAQQMQMEMTHRLPAVRPVVGHNPETGFGDPFLKGDCFHRPINISKKRQIRLFHR